jgi:hypothetical protein
METNDFYVQSITREDVCLLKDLFTAADYY